MKFFRRLNAAVRQYRNYYLTQASTVLMLSVCLGVGIAIYPHWAAVIDFFLAGVLTSLLISNAVIRALFARQRQLQEMLDAMHQMKTDEIGAEIAKRMQSDGARFPPDLRPHITRH